VPIARRTKSLREMQFAPAPGNGRLLLLQKF
jgi:hypothetical protein